MSASSLASPPAAVSAAAPRALGRLVSLDALRGALMILILITHAFALLGPVTLNGPAFGVIGLVFAAATPSFVLISGTLFGLFLATRSSLTAVFRSYRLRALLFVGVAHALIAVELYPVLAGARMPFWQFFVMRWYITDTLAVVFLLMPAILPALRVWDRLTIGIVLLTVSRLDAVLAWARSPAAIIAHQVFFGRLVSANAKGFDCYPLLPIFGFFMIGSFIGGRLGAAYDRRPEDFLARLRRAAWPLAGASLLMCAGWAALKFKLPGHPAVQALLYPDRTFSLAPGYMAGFLAALVFLLRRLDLAGRVTRWGRALALLGRRSLFAFVTQYGVVMTLPATLGHRYVSLRGLALYLPVAVATVFGLTAGWDRLRRAVSVPTVHDLAHGHAVAPGEQTAAAPNVAAPDMRAEASHPLGVASPGAGTTRAVDQHEAVAARESEFSRFRPS